jgi:hypothetical protein
MSLRTRSLSFRTAAWLRRNSWCKEQQLFSAETTSFTHMSLGGTVGVKNSSCFQQEQLASLVCPSGQGHCPLEQQLGLGGTVVVKNSCCFQQEQPASLICPLGQGHCPLEQQLGLGGTVGVKNSCCFQQEQPASPSCRSGTGVSLRMT